MTRFVCILVDADLTSKFGKFSFAVQVQPGRHDAKIKWKESRNQGDQVSRMIKVFRGVCDEQSDGDEKRVYGRTCW